MSAAPDRRHGVSSVQRARRPVSYADAPAGAGDTEPCEGRQASPSNPSGPRRKRGAELLTETIVLRCTSAEKAALHQRAVAAGLPASTLLREALGLAYARRRKPVPRADPALVLAVGRIGGNVNQIASALNRATASGPVTALQVIAVSRHLLAIERQLAKLIAGTPRC